MSQQLKQASKNGILKKNRKKVKEHQSNGGNSNINHAESSSTNKKRPTAAEILKIFKSNKKTKRSHQVDEEAEEKRTEDDEEKISEPVNKLIMDEDERDDTGADVDARSESESEDQQDEEMEQSGSDEAEGDMNNDDMNEILNESDSDSETKVKSGINLMIMPGKANMEKPKEWLKRLQNISRDITLRNDLELLATTLIHSGKGDIRPSLNHLKSVLPIRSLFANLPFLLAESPTQFLDNPRSWCIRILEYIGALFCFV